MTMHISQTFPWTSTALVGAPVDVTWKFPDMQIHNGLCTCRGWHDPHPFHAGSPMVAGHLAEPKD